MSQIDDQIIEQIKERTRIGEIRYGGTVDRPEHPPKFWRTMLQEELIDALKYNQRCINDENALLKDFVRRDLDWLKYILTGNPSQTWVMAVIRERIEEFDSRLKELEGK